MIQKWTHAHFLILGHRIFYSVDAQILMHLSCSYNTNCQNEIWHILNLIIMTPYKIVMVDMPWDSFLHVCLALMMNQGCFQG